MSRLAKVVSIDEEFEKAKPYSRFKGGKFERVKGYAGKLGGAEEKEPEQGYSKPGETHKNDLIADGWNEVANGLFKNREAFPGHSFTVYSNGHWKHNSPSRRGYGEEYKGVDYESFKKRLKYIHKDRLEMDGHLMTFLKNSYKGGE